MKIINHGNALSFCCNGCGCKWVANKKECQTRTKYIECMPVGYDYIYDCPECGFRTVGTEIKAEDVHE